MTNDNPFMSGEFATPFQVPPFDKISIEHYEPAIDAAIDKALKEIDAITSNPDTPTYENTMVPYENAGRDLDRILNVFGPMLSAMSTPEMMELSLRVQPRLTDYYLKVSLDRKMFERIRYVYEETDLSKLDSVDRRRLELTFDSLKKGGALLEDDKREELKKVSARLSELTTLFSQNVLKEINGIKIDLHADEIGGLPDHIIEEARELAREDGKSDDIYTFTLHQPVYMEVMRYLDRRDIREMFYRRYSSRNIDGEFSNIDIIREIVRLRAHTAAILGYKTLADMTLEKKMAKNPENVYRLLEDLRRSYDKAAHKEVEDLQDFARSEAGKDFKLMPWDYSYWFNRMRRARFDFDEQAVRPYFELNKVIDGVFGLANRLYGIRLVENTDLPKYHEDVRTYEVVDADDTVLGVLYTDFFPRSTKQPGAWMTEFKGQWINSDGKDSRPVISIVMNFTKPSGSKPSLLTPGEVRTFLHEFGHALHGLLTKVKYESMSGTNVPRDFVELPSQFNENFLTCPEFLDGFARHYQTGEPIPVEEIDKIIASSQFGAAYACFRQLGFGFLDMAYHTLEENNADIPDVEKFEKEATASVALFPEIRNAMISPQFGHIFSGGYAAGYYSYKWSEVLDADAFAVFKKEGVFNPETARRFRKEILEKGNSDDPAVLYRNFKGEEPSVEALLERDGIK